MKMLVSDYDSTFYISDDDIKLNVQVVNQFMKKSKNYFVIATGRSYLDFIKEKEKYSINYNYLIINHGSTLIKDNNIIYNCCIDNEIKNRLIDKLDFSSLVNYFCCSGLDSRVSIDSKDITKINIEYSSESEARLIYDKLLSDDSFSDFLNIFLVCSNKALEIVAKNTDKANTVKYLQDYLGIETKNIYVIGDNYTDYLMIKNYSGYCMRNSVDKIRKIATKEYSCVSDLVLDIENG